MLTLKSRIATFAPTRLPVLITGPTGSGKELVARAVHAASGRSGAFVAFNVCAVSDAMFEDALFGHVRGAFTGATHDRNGYLAEANGGSMFLDEIGSMAPPAQSKLLRAIETGAFRAVGAACDRVSDFRVIAATNEPLSQMADAGRFRTDLLHRLAGVVLNVPSLAARREDIAVLVPHFLVACGHTAGISARATRQLERHDWPGNVRELRHTIERAAILAGPALVDSIHVLHALHDSRLDGQDASDNAGRNDLLEILQAVAWNTALAAERLGVHRATIYRRIRQYSLRRSEVEPRGQPARGRRLQLSDGAA